MLELWFFTFGAEIVLYSSKNLWKYRRFIATIITFFIAYTSVWVWTKLGSWLGFGFSLLTIFRILNLLRIVKNRMHPSYLLSATTRTSLILMLFHPLLVAFLILNLVYSGGSGFRILQFVQLGVGFCVFSLVVKNSIKLKYRELDNYLSDKDLPTVTIAIPARNETNDLEECLQSVLASDYPKLEIIVLDDCSQSRTSDIIKAFAHKGVRFVQGLPPADRWLAKNQAYEKLYHEASGEFILFCGVDVRFGVQSVRNLVNTLGSRNKSMVSVMPVRIKSSAADLFVQPMRYWWELALPRKLFNKPAVLSTCWIINKKKLAKLGGFAAVSHAILPEVYFARELVKVDGYSFVRSSSSLQVQTTKSFREQYETSVRTKYPQVRRRPEWTLFLSATSATLLLLPFVMLASSFWVGSINKPIAILVCLLLIVSQVIIVNMTDPSNSLLSVITFPAAVVSEIIVSCLSMIRYEFMTVNWKDRNICIPVMHVLPRLPEINFRKTNI